MQIPVPTLEAILMGVLIAAVVLIFRWLRIYSIARLLHGPADLAKLSTANRSQISELALVNCSLGMTYDHAKTGGMHLRASQSGSTCTVDASVVKYARVKRATYKWTYSNVLRAGCIGSSGR